MDPTSYARENAYKQNLRLAKKILPHYEPYSPVLKKIKKFIDSHKKFLLTTHVGADPDGVGSELGLYYLLKSLGKEVTIINNEALGESLRFLDPENLIKDIQAYQNDLESLKKEILGSFVFIVDSSELKRSEKVAELFLSMNCPYATIDHHILPNEPNYCVDPDYAATAEMIWDLYKFYKKKISEKAALALYTGIVADSGNFRYPKTSFRTHLAGADLLALGINSDAVYRAIYENHPTDRLILLQRVLKKAEINKEKGYVIAEIKPKMYRNLDLGESPNEGIVNLLLGSKEIRLSAVITQTPDGLKCSLRSKGEVNVMELAKKFGGGGHKNAAGLKIEGDYKKLSRELKDSIRKYINLF